MSDVDLGGWVEHQLRPDRGQELRERIGVADIGLLERRAPFERPLELRPFFGQQIVDDCHAIAAFDERIDEVGADDSCPAGDDAIPGRGDLRDAPAVGIANRAGADRARCDRLQVADNASWPEARTPRPG